MFKGKKILVTGGSGFVGSNLIQKLLSTGATTRATLHQNEPQIVDDRVEYIRCDLRLAEDCQRVCRDMDYVFLCAAHTSGAGIIETTPLVHLTPNVLMNVLMLEAAYAAGVKKVLFISSNVVYPVTDTHVKEDDAGFTFFEKYHIAAWMKKFSEVVCDMYASHIRQPMSTVVVRPANIYGPLDDFDWETSHVIPSFIRRVVERHKPIKIWGDGQDIKDLIYVDDFIDGILAAMEATAPFDIVNIASGKGYRLDEILQIIIRLDGYEDAEVAYDVDKPKMIPKRLIDATKAEKVLNFTAKTPIEDGLLKTINWYRSTIGLTGKS